MESGSSAAQRDHDTGRRGLVLAAAISLLFGCSGTSSTSAPAQCQRTDRHGTYLSSYQEHSGGTCGPLTGGLVTVGGDTAGDAGSGPCSVKSELWEEGDCKLTSQVHCEDTTHLSDATYITHQQTADGSKITGLYSYSLRSRACELCPEDFCSSTYDVTLIRQ